MLIVNEYHTCNEDMSISLDIINPLISEPRLRNCLIISCGSVVLRTTDSLVIVVGILWHSTQDIRVIVFVALSYLWKNSKI